MADAEEKNAAVLIATSKSNLLADSYFGAAEETFYQSGYVPDSQMNPFNPDKLVRKAGDYSVYEEMADDDQVSICLGLKKDLVIGGGFDIIPGDESQEEVVEFLKDALVDNPSIALEEKIEEILSAYEFGFSMTEKIFEIGVDGLLRVKDLRTRHPNSWQLEVNVKGVLDKIKQIGTPEGDKILNPKSLIHYINKPKFQNPYGTSDLKTAYAAWFAKRQIVRWYAIFMEKAASPTPVARYDKNAPQSAVQKLHNIIKSFQTKTAITIPKEVEIDFLESKTTGEAYWKAINLFNMFIGRSLFVPDLIGLQGSETGGGSYSLGKDQIRMFLIHIARRRNIIERIINRHLVIPICLWNYGELKKYPKFKLKSIDDGTALEFAKLWMEAVKSKVWRASDEEINYFRAMINFPIGDVERDAPTPNLPPGITPPGTTPNPNDTESDNEDVTEKEDGLSGKPGSEEEDGAKDGAAPKEFALISDLAGDYKKKVDFKVLKTKMDFYQQAITAEAAPIIKKIFADLVDQIEKKKILQGQKSDRIETIQLKYLKELKQTIKANLLDLYNQSQIVAAKELDKREFKAPLTANKFMEVLENDIYSYVGDWAYTITKDTKKALFNALKDGKSLGEILGTLNDNWNQLSDTSLERYSRTKITETMNRARKDYFDEGDIIQGYQYAAVLDDRTSSICETLNGKIFSKDDAPTPPLHFNCRSILIPITKYEKMTPTSSIGGKDPTDWVKEKAEETGFAVNA